MPELVLVKIILMMIRRRSGEDGIANEEDDMVFMMICISLL